jgi:hypothetical protein
MAIHENQWSMAAEVIDEYLRASQLCLEDTKPDGGCLGYTATLLLFCAVNALGSYLAGDKVEIQGKQHRITDGEPFRVLNHACFGLSLSHHEIKQLESSYRNALAHNAMIEPAALLFAIDGVAPFEFKSGAVWIRLLSFQNRVAEAWKVFPKGRIQLWERSRNRKGRQSRPRLI